MATFALACAFATIHYYMGRFVVISLLFFYLINLKEFSILNFKTYNKITNFKNNYPNSEEIYSKIINLPMGNNLTEKDTLEIVKIIKKWN